MFKKPVQNSSRSAPALPPLAMRLRLSWNHSDVRRAAAQIRTFLGAHRLLEKDIWACELAFVEACNNTVRHTPPAQQSGFIQVEIGCSNGEVELRIDDHTAGFELPRRVALPQDDQESGRGLYLIISLMDHVGYVRSSGSANCLVLQKKFTGI